MNTRFFDWHITKWAGIIAVFLYKPWIHLTRKVKIDVELTHPVRRSEIILLASNHQSAMDTLATFGVLNLRNITGLSPSKFMVWHKYYNSRYRPALWAMGAFSSHKNKFSGVKGSVYFLRNGYRLLMYPEGRRIKENKRTPAYPGISNIIKRVPESRLILVYINWGKRETLLSRPLLVVSIFDSPAGLDKKDPDAIMDAIYNHRQSDTLAS